MASDTYSRSTDEAGNYLCRKTSYDARTLCSLNAGVTLSRGISLNLGVDNSRAPLLRRLAVLPDAALPGERGDYLCARLICCYIVKITIFVP